MHTSLTQILFVFIAITGFYFSSLAQSYDGESIAIGTWLSGSENEKIEIYKKSDGLYYGKLVWSKTTTNEDGSLILDVLNPNEKLRNREMIGMDILERFEYKGDKEFRGGKVYDPTRGKYYSAIIKFTDDDTVEVRPFIFIPLIGRTEVATRVKSN